MSGTASITITYTAKVPALNIIDVMMQAGWAFPDNKIYHTHYKKIYEISTNEQLEPANNWLEVQDFLKDCLRNRETIGVRLQWDKMDVVGDFHINTKQKLKKLRIIFLESRPKINPTQITDYTWLLSKILIPITDSGYQLLEMECRDDHF